MQFGPAYEVVTSTTLDPRRAAGTSSRRCLQRAQRGRRPVAASIARADTGPGPAVVFGLAALDAVVPVVTSDSTRERGRRREHGSGDARRSLRVLARRRPGRQGGDSSAAARRSARAHGAGSPSLRSGAVTRLAWPSSTLDEARPGPIASARFVPAAAPRHVRRADVPSASSGRPTTGSGARSGRSTRRCRLPSASACRRPPPWLGLLGRARARSQRSRSVVEVGRKLASRDYRAGMNRLAEETSPYLLQHADNPVDWYPVGRGGARAARATRTGRSCSRSATRPATGAT